MVCPSWMWKQSFCVYFISCTHSDAQSHCVSIVQQVSASSFRGRKSRNCTLQEEKKGKEKSMAVSMFPAAPKIKQLSARQHALGLTSLSFSVSPLHWHTQSNTHGECPQTSPWHGGSSAEGEQLIRRRRMKGKRTTTRIAASTWRTICPLTVFLLEILSHLNVSDHETNINIKQRQPEKYTKQWLAMLADLALHGIKSWMNCG